MTNEEKILEMLTVLQSDMQDVKGRLTSMDGRLTSVESRLTSVEDRLTSVEEKLEDLTESQEEVRTSVNVLLDWAERVSSIEQLHIPRIG